MPDYSLIERLRRRFNRRPRRRGRRHFIHRWYVISVDWPTPHARPRTIAFAVCDRPGCPKTKRFTFRGANITIEAARYAIH